MAASPVQFEPIHKPLEGSNVPKKKKTVKVCYSFRLSRQVSEALDSMAKQEAFETGYHIDKTQIVSAAIMERYRRKKVKRKT